MTESVNKKFIYYGFMVLFFLGFIVTSIGFFSQINRLNKIKNDSYKTFAIVVSEKQNLFGGKKSYSYILRYNYDNQQYLQSASGMYNTGYYKIGEKIEIILEKSKPTNFFILADVNYKGTFLIAISCLIISILMYRYQVSVINYWKEHL